MQEFEKGRLDPRSSRNTRGKRVCDIIVSRSGMSTPRLRGERNTLGPGGKASDNNRSKGGSSKLGRARGSDVSFRKSLRKIPKRMGGSWKIGAVRGG